MVEETKREMFGKVNNLEARVEKEGKRLVEMEKYKLDLVQLRDNIYNKQTNTLGASQLNIRLKKPSIL